MGRQNEMISNLENLNCDDTEPIKESNNEWKKYMLNLSKSIAGNTQQFNCLLNIINDGFLKELNGRINDLNHVNNVYYDEDVNDHTQKIDFIKLKDNVNQRHDEISNDVKTSKETISKQEDDETKDENDDNNNNTKIKELYQGLLTTNTNWNELISISSTMYTESESAKNNLIQQLLSKYMKLQELMEKVDKLPSTKLF